MTFVGQTKIDISKVPAIPYKPKVAINNFIQYKTLSLDSILKYGIEVVLDDKSYKVIQFAIIFDCHSKFLLDFSYKTYSGSTVSPIDPDFRKKNKVGDLIEIADTVIENGGQRYLMSWATYQIIR